GALARGGTRDLCLHDGGAAGVPLPVCSYDHPISTKEENAHDPIDHQDGAGAPEEPGHQGRLAGHQGSHAEGAGDHPPDSRATEKGRERERDLIARLRADLAVPLAVMLRACTAKIAMNED